MEDKQEIRFYTSKVKFFLLVLMMLVLTVFSIVVCVAAFGLADYGMAVLGGLMTLTFAALVYVGVKKLRNKGPYVILTEHELIIGAATKRPIHIEREDIDDYRLYTINFNKFVGIILDDEEKYREQMSSKMKKLYKMNDVMNLPLFNIAMSQVKRKDQKQLLHELEGDPLEIEFTDENNP